MNSMSETKPKENNLQDFSLSFPSKSTVNNNNDDNNDNVHQNGFPMDNHMDDIVFEDIQMKNSKNKNIMVQPQEESSLDQSQFVIQSNTANNNDELEDDSFDDFQTHFPQQELKLEPRPYEKDIINNLNSNLKEEIKQVYTNNVNLDIGDDFADFASFNTGQNVVFFANSDNVEQLSNQSSELNNEIEKTSSAKENAADDDEDFADFTSASITEPTTVATDFNNQKQSTTIQNLASKDYKQLIQVAFPIDKQEESFDQFIPMLNLEFFEKNNSLDDSKKLWVTLQQLDLKMNFNFSRWKQSNTFKHLLGALKIDPRNVIPPDLFASLSPLSSSNATTASSTITTTNYHQSFENILQPTIYSDYSSRTKMTDLTKHVPSATMNHSKTTSDRDCAEDNDFSGFVTIVDNISNKDNIAPQSQTNIAPMFTNCLAQDLDFFETKYVLNSKSGDSFHLNKVTDDFIAEFIDEFLIKNQESVEKTEESQTNDIVDGIQQLKLNLPPPPISLSSQVKFQTSDILTPTKVLKTTNNEQVLSAEALQILTELPNLSMIRTGVLMFPAAKSDTTSDQINP